MVLDFNRSGRALLLGFVLAMALTPVACSHPGKGLQTGSYERGMAEFEGERWYDAVETLKLFVRRNPTDPRVDEAQYHIGMARFEDEDFPVAAVEFEILRRDYPDSPLVEDAWYMEGLCYVRQVPPIHREQAVTRKGIAHFQRYLQSFPQGRRSEDAQRELRALQRHLDEKDLAAVRLYRRLGRDEAARITLDVVLENRPQSELRPEMLYLAGQLHRDLEQPDRARVRWNALVTEFPDHDLARRAQQDLRDLPTETQRAEGSGR